MLPLITSLRPHQWTKNLVIFAGLFFSGRGTSTEDVLRECSAFALFCLLSSAVYLFNDVRDVERDRLHPVKRNRPIAAGKLKASTAMGLAAALAAGALGGAAALGTNVLAVFAAYLLLQVGYTLKLKHLVIVDVFCIAAGFLLRVLAGVFTTGADLSPWLVACSVQLALFLALCKRRAEALAVQQSDADAASQRPILSEYAGQATDMMIAVMASATVVTYTLYTILPGAILQLAPRFESRAGAPGMVWTVPFVLYGILRYLYLVYNRERGERPEFVLFTDRPLIAAIVLYGVVAGVVIYAG